MSALAVCLYVAAGMESLNALVLITRVGASPEQLAKAYTGPNVAGTVALTAGIVVVLVVAALHLSG